MIMLSVSFTTYHIPQMRVSFLIPFTATARKPWCPIKVDPVTFDVITGHWGLCLDEKQMAWNRGTQGSACNIPFLVNEK
jgi:hypothetical protein